MYNILNNTDMKKFGGFLLRFLLVGLFVISQPTMLFANNEIYASVNDNNSGKWIQLDWRLKGTKVSK